MELNTKHILIATVIFIVDMRLMYHVRAVCYVTQHSTVYMLPAKYTCPSEWTREYYGYLMSEHHSHHLSQFSCIDYAFKSMIGSKHMMMECDYTLWREGVDHSLILHMITQGNYYLQFVPSDATVGVPIPFGYSLFFCSCT